MTDKIKCYQQGCETEVSETVAKFSAANYDGKIYCFTHQKAHPKVQTVNGKEGKDPDDMITLSDLLGMAHKKGLKSITTECITYNSEKKSAMFKATVIMYRKGGASTDGDMVFTGHGDVDQENLKKESFVSPHWYRMAETRAIVRALRWATNEARAAEEEKG